MNEEHCPNCHKHCHKDNLHCGRGRAYFNVQTSAPSGALMKKLAQLESTFKACENKSVFFNCLTDCEKSILSAIIDKLNEENEKK